MRISKVNLFFTLNAFEGHLEVEMSEGDKLEKLVGIVERLEAINAKPRIKRTVTRKYQDAELKTTDQLAMLQSKDKPTDQLCPDCVSSGKRDSWLMETPIIEKEGKNGLRRLQKIYCKSCRYVNWQELPSEQPSEQSEQGDQDNGQ